MSLTFLKQIAHGLSIQFGDNCEIVVHDLTKKNIEDSIVYIENGHISNRKIGDGPSQIVLKTLHKDPAKIKDQLGYLTKTSDGKTLKSSTLFIRQEETNQIQYILSINYDITNLLYLEHSIHSLIKSEAKKVDQDADPKRITQNVNELLDELIEQSIALIGKPVPLMNKEDKILAIQFLNDAGAFLITKSSDKVSNFFGISKYTLYHYLDLKNNDSKEDIE